MKSITADDGAGGSFRACLQTIVGHPVLEAEWLDLLSQMEYVGCRKILRSQRFDRVTLEVLQHISEEASHAFLLRRCAQNKGIAKRSWDGGLFSTIGWDYFHRLDYQVSNLVTGVQAYPMVSWAIERRVLQIYPLYLEVNQDEEIQSVLKQILGQERRHMKQFESVELDKASEEVAGGIESGLWNEFEACLWLRIAEFLKTE